MTTKREKPMNEIDAFIQEAIGCELIGERETEKWVRRRLRKLVREAYCYGWVHQDQASTVVSLSPRELDYHQKEECKKRFGFKP